MVRSVRGASCDIEEIRLIGRDRFGSPNPCDRPIGDIRGQVVVWVSRSGHEITVLIKNLITMVHVDCVKPIEVIESQSVSPSIKRASRAGFPCWRVVILPDPRRHVPILAQNLPDGTAASRQDARISVVSRSRFSYAGE